MYDSYTNTRSWSNSLSQESDKIRFEYCPDSHGEPQYIRSIKKVTVANQEFKDELRMSRHVHPWEMAGESPRHGRTSQEVCGFCRVLLAFRRMDAEERGVDGRQW